MEKRIEITITDEDEKFLGKYLVCSDAADCPYYSLSNVCDYKNGKDHFACPVEVEGRKNILKNKEERIKNTFAYQAAKSLHDEYEELLKK